MAPRARLHGAARPSERRAAVSSIAERSKQAVFFQPSAAPDKVKSIFGRGLKATTVVQRRNFMVEHLYFDPICAVPADVGKIFTLT
jgi:hypothetical protein